MSFRLGPGELLPLSTLYGGFRPPHVAYFPGFISAAGGLPGCFPY